MALQRKRINLSVGKRYEVANLLGKGSFSAVYLAYHKTFGNKVALKIIDRKNIKEEYVSRNLYREAHILMKLNHPNIVSFYEEILHYDLYCLSMEYVCGVDLAQYLKRQTLFKVSERTAKLLFYQMVSAVDHMHKLNVLHRDLKQENIMVEFGRVIKIVDFGLSNVYQPTLHLRTHCGSLIYAAPELFEHHSVYGAPVDLWSLGVILYSMVTGRMPFELSKKSPDESPCTSRMDFYQKKISKGLTQEHSTIMAKLSSDCRHLVERLLEPNQFKRLKVTDAMIHPWFDKDVELKQKLPQERMDLKRKFEPDIKDFMADYMGVPIQRIHNHVTQFRFSKISAIYFIARDTLIKEILYPPKDLENSFIYKFDYWRKTNLGIDSNEELEEDMTKLKNKKHNFKSKIPVPPGFNHVEIDYFPEKESRSNASEQNVILPQSVGNIQKETGNGGCFAKHDPSLDDIPILRESKQKVEEPNVNFKILQPNGDHKLSSHPPMTGVPFRSYKSNRPTKFIIQKCAKNAGYASYSRNSGDVGTTQHYEEAPQNTNVCVVKLDNVGNSNYQNDLISFNESFVDKCRINTQQMVKQPETEKNEIHYPNKKFQLESEKLKATGLPGKVAKNQNAKQKFSVEPTVKNMPSMEQYRLKSDDKGPVKQAFFNGTPEKVYINKNTLHKQQKHEKEPFPQRQKSMTIKRSYQIPNATFRHSKAPACNFRYGPPSTFVQTPAFGMSLRSTKEYDNNKSRRFHMETQVCKKII